MSYTYLLEQAEGYLEECYSDTPQFALWKSNLTAAESCCNASAMESCQNSQSGTTCEPSTANPGGDALTACAEDFRARTFPQPIQTQKDLKGIDRDFGGKCTALFMKYYPKECSLKTHQCFENVDLLVSRVHLPSWGMMRDGEFFQLAPLVSHIHGKECSLWPTVTKMDGVMKPNETRIREIEAGYSPGHGGGCKNLREYACARGRMDESGMDRVVDGVANQLDRIRAVGNGQVPEVVRLAWETLNYGLD